MKKLATFFAFLLTFALVAETVGKRPYELDWAGRTEDTYPDKVLTGFEEEGWTGACDGGEIAVERSREQQLFGDYVLKATYCNTAEGSQTYAIRPPEPIPAPESFDTVTLWVYGNKEAMYKDRSSIGPVNVVLELRNADGKTTEVLLYNVVWHEWFMCHKRLTEKQRAEFSRPGTVVTGILLKPANNRENRTLYFDSLTLYTEEFKPLEFTRRPKRNLTLFPGQDPGANTGEGTLPFPTREETILPDSAAPGSTVTLSQSDNSYTYIYKGTDGELKVTYTPASGTWSDFTASWNGGPAFQPLAEGGVKFLGSATPNATLVSCAAEGGKVKAVWNYTLADGHVHEVAYHFELKGKTLVLDTLSSNSDNQLETVSYGEVAGVECLDLLQIPYYDYGHGAGRPAVALVKAGEAQFFLSGHTDWYRSNGSCPTGGQYPHMGKLQVNGQVRYVPKTDGKRNDVFERFFVTISPSFEEHLPNLPNPPSPWRHITGSIIWRAYGAHKRENDKRCWHEVWRYGMRKCLVTDHETMWRDGEESFTFRTRTAPGKGGDEGARDYSRYMQETLGFVYGPYNNFTDFAPVNGYWDTDMVTRQADNQLMGAWRRCYRPKPLRGLEFCEKLTPIIEEKFHFSTAYCDVHTSVAPWETVDFDFRVPGAGTFAQTFYAYGEIMLIQKKCWDGPVYSEGPHFCYFSGLTDGNYAQDRTYRLFSRPWLVDFDLRKIHDLECNFGIGAMTMFYGEQTLGSDNFSWLHDGRTDAHLDRFFTATIAFGHPGFLVLEGGIRNALRSYYLLQQIETRYTQAKAKDIYYCGDDGKPYRTTEAIANGAYRNSQVVVDYANGTHVVANGSNEKPLTLRHAGREISLAPNTFVAWTEDGEYFSTNAPHEGFLADYAESPEYIYLNARDQIHHVMPKADGVGQVICRSDDAEHWEFIGLDGAQGGFAVEGGNARAYAFDGKDLGPATAVRCRGMLYVLPVEGAFSYKLEKSAVTPETALSSESYEVFSGDTVTIQTPNGPVERVITGQPGQRAWVEIDGEHICFVIRGFVDFQAELDAAERHLLGQLRNLGSTALAVQVKPSFGAEQTVELAPHETAELALAVPAAASEGEEPIAIDFVRNSLSVNWKGTLRRQLATDVIFDEFTKTGRFVPGSVVLTKKTSTDPFSLGARVAVEQNSCGGVIRPGLFTHPCWLEGCHGNTFVTYLLDLPAVPDLLFSGFVGKKDGSYLGDGMRFYVCVIPEGETDEQRIAEVSVARHEWKPIEADLTPWAGRKIQLRLLMDIGPALDSSGDWGAWGDLRITRREPRLKTTLK